MKILHIFFSFNRGGAETMLVDIMNEQIKTNSVSLLIINNLYCQSLIETIDHNVKCYFINRTPGSLNLFKIFKLNKLIYYINPDIIHCHDVNIINILWGVKAIKCATLHNVKSNTSYLKKYDAIFAISEAVKEYIKKYSNLEAKVIYNGIYPFLVKFGNRDISLKKTYRIVQVGRLNTTIKGQHLIIQAIKQLSNEGYDITLDLIGNGPSLLDLKEMVHELNIENQVNFCGEKSRSELYENLCNYDLLVQPSLYEGFGITIIEAMAAHIPVLVSNLPGPMEVIDYGKCGYFFESENVDDLIMKIKEIMKKKSKSKLENAFSRVCLYFDISQSAKDYIEIYHNLLK